MSVTIHRATREDLHRLVRLTTTAIRTQQLGKVFPPAPSTLVALGEALLARGVIFIAERGGVWLGAIGVIKIAHPFSGAEYGECVGWFVDPHERSRTLGRRVAATLLGRAEGWCIEERLVGLKVAAPAGSQLPRGLARRGYTLAETAHFRPLTQFHFAD